MSKSGIPVISQIGSAAGAVGSAIGNIINPKSPSVATPPPTASPANNGADLQNAEEQESQTAGRGQAADILTSGMGLSTQAPVARNVLLGS